jgi:hypothetical protein
LHTVRSTRKSSRSGGAYSVNRSMCGRRASNAWRCEGLSDARRSRRLRCFASSGRCRTSLRGGNHGRA